MRWEDRKVVGVADLVGQTLVSVTQGHGGDGNTVTFVTDTGKKYVMYHESDCCESVDIDFVQDLRGAEVE